MNTWTKREEVIEVWRKQHNNGLHDLYSSPNITRVINSRGIIWVRPVAYMGQKTNPTGF